MVVGKYEPYICLNERTYYAIIISKTKHPLYN